MKSFIFGNTSSGLPITGFHWQAAGPKVLILGGVHGDEVEGVIAAQSLLNEFARSFPFRLDLTLVPMFNFDGVIQKTRSNARGVDLNRNLPTKDWNPKAFDVRYNPGPSSNSEPENQALVDFLKVNKCKFILSLHSWKPLLNINGRCHKEAQVISQLTGYEIKDEIGYPTPGCLGTYTGLERDMPTITYEIERGLDTRSILHNHVPAILEALKVVERDST